MRSEDSADVEDVCNDPLVQTACLMGSDKCPAACQEKEDNTTDDEEVVVKSGDLAVSAEAAGGKSVIIGGTNDLDTLTFKTSEEVELTKVVLERYGYSTADEVAEVRLEDEDGNKIADERSLNSKDQVTLTIKKDYRNVDGSLNATVVVRTLDCNTSTLCTKNGSTIGFKVVDATSTAKNVNLGNYKPNTYDIVSYTAGTLTLNTTAANKTYNYEADESYEIAKFKTTNNGSSAITVNGFTLHQYGTMAAEDFVTDVTVTANGEEVKGVKASFNKDDELVVSFNSFEIAAKKKVTFAVSAKLANDFDEYTKSIAFALQDTDDINAVEGKVDARVIVSASAGSIYSLDYNKADKKWQYKETKDSDAADWAWPVYTFNGGKIKLTNTKLGNIDAAAGSNDVVIAEGSLSITEAIKGTFSVVADNAGIDALTLVVAGEEFDSKKSNDGKTFTFTNVEIEKGGKIQFKADFDNDDNLKGTVINLGTFKASSFSELKYVENKENASDEMAGSITFSKVTIQEAKASLVNDADDVVEFIKGESSREVIFNGTYTAKKADVYLNEFSVLGNLISEGADMTFYLFVNNEEVADVDLGDSQTFSNVLVKAGEKAKIVVEAEVDASVESVSNKVYSITLKGEDIDNLPVKDASADSVEMKVVNKGTVSVTDVVSKNDVLLRKANTTLATFNVKPDNKNSTNMYLEDLTLEACVLNADGTDCASYLVADDLIVKFDGSEEDGNDYPKFSETATYKANDHVIYTDGKTYKANADINTASAWDASNWTVVNEIYYDLNEELGDGIKVEVVLKTKQTGTVKVSIKKVNEKTVGTKEFKKRFEEALVRVSTENSDGSTKVVLTVEKADSATTVSKVSITTDEQVNGNDRVYEIPSDEITSTEDFEVSPGTDKNTHFITSIKYCLNAAVVADCNNAYDSTTKKGYVIINKEDFNDYFKDGSSYAKIFKVD